MHVPTYQFQEGEQDLWRKHIIMLTSKNGKMCWYTSAVLLIMQTLHGSPRFNIKKMEKLQEFQSCFAKKIDGENMFRCSLRKKPFNILTLLLVFPAKGHLSNDLQKFNIWRVTTLNWVMLLNGCKFASAFQKHTTQIVQWHIICIELLWLFLRCHIAGKPLVTCYSSG